MKNYVFSPLVLFVEDDTSTIEPALQAFRKVAIRVIIVHTLHDASCLLSEKYVNILLLSERVVDGSGFDFSDKLRRSGILVPTIFLLNQPSMQERLRALEYGDDVMEKPLNFLELVARTCAVLRRASTARDWHLTENVTLRDKPFIFCGATADPATLTIAFNTGVKIGIGKREMGLMSFFESTQNTILSRKDIIHHVWGLHANLQSRSLDQYIVRIRRILRNNGHPTEEWLRTIHSVGYLYMVPRKDDSNDTNHDNGLVVVD
jgi:two-component system alkaline phosphatase synthesis response regulator PhoP